ncbi:hypothetical protein ACGFK1_20655 [Mycobacterium sp. NPDC048908]|uniref:hypothetical protein n=1 Tax=Mycobacterium sp. NPDC048908 TaxID=3364292 RepID=UPI0037176966
MTMKNRTDPMVLEAMHKEFQDSNGMVYEVAEHWRREEDPFRTRFTTGLSNNCGLITREELYDELRRIMVQEMKYVRDEHAVSLVVEVQLTT